MTDNKIFTDEEIAKILELINDTRHTQYIGARYVPIFGRKNEQTMEWDNKAPYEPLTIVLHEGNSYTSRQYVPTGTDITNTEFWAETGNYNAQIEQYRVETQASTNKFAAMGIDTTEKATEFLNRVEKLDTDNEFNKNVIKAGFGADTVEAADTSFKANYMDIRKLGCKPDDTNANNAQLINAWLTNNPKSALYVPNGEWYVESTIKATLNDIYMDGTFHPVTNGTYEDNWIVKLIGTNTTSQSSYDQAMNKHFRIKVNCDMTENNGIFLSNYFETDFDLIVIKCHATGIQVNRRIIECYLKGKIYGAYTGNTNSPDTDFAQKGLEVLKGNNDNQAVILARNVKLGIDLNSSVWTFHYIHVWGCTNVLKLYPNTDTQITKFYTDYAIKDSIITDNTTDETQSLYIDSIFGIMLDNTHIIDASQYVLTINHIYAYYVNDNAKTPYAALTNDVHDRNIHLNINESSKYNITLDDLNTLTATQLIDKYGDIRFTQCLIPISFPTDPTWKNWADWLNTPYAQNLKALLYPLPDTIKDSIWTFGRTKVTYQRQKSQGYQNRIAQILHVGEDVLQIASREKIQNVTVTSISE